MTHPSYISPIQALCARCPDFFESLTEKEWLVIPFLPELWLRPEQQILAGDWRYLTLIGGRGWGKSFAIATEINRRVAAGTETLIGLMAPTEDRVEQVQIQFLIATAPPWFRPERYLGGLRWPNGVIAEVHTAIEPGRARGGNFSTSWLTELVDWQATTRRDAFSNITTATRVGRAQVFIDTTSKGKNELIQGLLADHEADPEAYPLVRGETFHNPLLTRKYIKAECRKYSGQDFGEEILGLVYAEAAGASYQQAWINRYRVKPHEVPPLVRKVVAVDPSLTTHDGSDDKGIVCGGDDGEGHVYVLADKSAPLTPEQWGDEVVRLCAEEDYSGCILETNHMGEQATFTVRSRAQIYRSAKFPQGLVVRKLEKGKPFPRRTHGVIWVREVFARTDKQARAGGPASETEAGHVHMAGTFLTLESQMTTFVVGTGQRSPNPYDAYNYLVTELRDLAEEKPRGAVRANAEQAAAAHAQLRAGLARVGRGRTI